ncbi:hypothetical protein C7999DRAFT_32172 [Corynascus novoguineensis]|uniref:NAD(P)-binding protein n=1 Tax=Corynascus novoguineensis TaxID=1126955 RepID=A0AAN7CSA6_9PEZI|nr:hypothetical protein C7999DRAFT_32172 [Corynascus novoguineensis]
MPELPEDKTVLVTNASEGVRLHTIKRLLAGGCRVRATVYDSKPAEYLDEVFESYKKDGKFERMVLLTQPPTRKRYWRNAVRGVHAIIHMPTIPQFGFKNDVENMWEQTEDSVTSILDAAELEPQMTAFVMTSHIAAATPLVVPTDSRVDPQDYNLAAVLGAIQESGKLYPDYYQLFYSCYVRAEQALWDWMEENNPHFKANVVVPSNVYGFNFATKYTDSWKHNWLWRLWHYGKSLPVVRDESPAQMHWYVDVDDVALLHVACVYDETIKNGERIMAFGCYRNWNHAIEILHEHYVKNVREEKEYNDEEFDERATREEAERRIPWVGEDGVKRGMLHANGTRMLEIMRRWKDYEGWKQFEDTVEECVDLFEKGGDDKPHPRDLRPPKPKPNPFLLPAGADVDEHHWRWIYRDDPVKPKFERMKDW